MFLVTTHELFQVERLPTDFQTEFDVLSLKIIYIYKYRAGFGNLFG